MDWKRRGRKPRYTFLFIGFAQGFLEASNVKLVDEIVNLMMAQRAYEVSAKVIQASDELMSMSNNLRR